MQDIEFKKQLFREVARRVIEQWPEDFDSLTSKDREFASKPLHDALDQSRMNGDLLSVVHSLTSFLIDGLVPAIQMMNYLPLTTPDQRVQLAKAATQRKINVLNKKLAERL